MKKIVFLSLGISILFVTFSLSLAFFEIIPGISKEQISQFYFVDYVGIIFVLSAQMLLKKKNKIAFIFYSISILGNILLGYLMGSYIIITYSLLSLYINIQNWLQWKKDEKIIVKETGNN